MVTWCSLCTFELTVVLCSPVLVLVAIPSRRNGMTLDRQHIAGAMVDSSGLVAGFIAGLLTATALFVGQQTGWKEAPEFKAVSLFIVVYSTHVITARLIVERRLLSDLAASTGDSADHNQAVQFAGAWSRSIGLGLVASAATAYFMLTSEMGWDVLNTNWAVASISGVVASTVCKWGMVCNPVFWLVRGRVRVGETDP